MFSVLPPPPDALVPPGHCLTAGLAFLVTGPPPKGHPPPRWWAYHSAGPWWGPGLCHPSPGPVHPSPLTRHHADRPGLPVGGQGCAPGPAGSGEFAGHWRSRGGQSTGCLEAGGGEDRSGRLRDVGAWGSPRRSTNWVAEAQARPKCGGGAPGRGGEGRGPAPRRRPFHPRLSLLA